MHKAPEPRVTALEVPGFISFADLHFLESRAHQPLWLIQCALIASYVFHSCQPLMGSGSVGRGTQRVWILHLLKHSQAGEGLHPMWHLGNLWLPLICAHSTPKVIHPVQNHPFLGVGKGYRQVETVPLVLSPGPRGSNCFSNCVKFVYGVNQHQATGKNVKIDCFTLF